MAKLIIVNAAGGPHGVPSIGQALAEASDGDVIEICPGTYHTQLNISKSITIRPHGISNQQPPPIVKIVSHKTVSIRVFDKAKVILESLVLEQTASLPLPAITQGEASAFELSNHFQTSPTVVRVVQTATLTCTACTFSSRSHAIIAAGNPASRLTLQNCLFQFVSGICVVALGDTQITANQIKVKDCLLQSFFVSEKAKVTVTQSELTGTTETTAVATTPASSSSSSASGSAPAVATSLVQPALVQCEKNGSVLLDAVSMTHCHLGVFVQDDAVAELKSCVIADVTAAFLFALGNSRASVNNCNFRRSRHSGVIVCGGASMKMNQVTISETEVVAVHVYGGANTHAELIKQPKGAEKVYQVQMSIVTIATANRGILIREHGSVLITDGKVELSRQGALTLTDRAVCMCRDTHMASFATCVTCSDESAIEVCSCHVTSKEGHGLLFRGKATALLTNQTAISGGLDAVLVADKATSQINQNTNFLYGQYAPEYFVVEMNDESLHVVPLTPPLSLNKDFSGVVDRTFRKSEHDEYRLEWSWPCDPLLINQWTNVLRLRVNPNDVIAWRFSVSQGFHNLQRRNDASQ